MVKTKKLAVIGSKGNYVTKPASIMRFTSRAERELVSFHAKNPESSGIPKEVLRQIIAEKMDKECFDVMLQEAQRTGKIVQSQGEVSHVEAGAGVKALEREAAAKLLQIITNDDASPRPLPEVFADSGLSSTLANKGIRILSEEGRITRLDAETYYATTVIARHKTAITKYIQENGPAKAADLKDAMGTSRKYAIPLLEFFDKEGFTKRDGDFRSLN